MLNEYNSLKASTSKLEQISMEMDTRVSLQQLLETLSSKPEPQTNLDPSTGQYRSTESIASECSIHRKIQLLKGLFVAYNVINENNEKLKESIQNCKLKDEWVKKGKEIFDRAKDKSAKRQERGMTRPVIEESWKSFYQYSVDKLAARSLLSDVDMLMNKGKLKGEKGDYYMIKMRPRIPYDCQSFYKEPRIPYDHQSFYKEPWLPLIACVNPKEGVLVIHQEDRETERQWRDKHFKNFRQDWLEGIKKRLGIEDIPKDFFEPLHVSDLSVAAIQLTVEKSKKEQLQSGNQDNNTNLLPFPLTEVVVTNITNPETTTILHRYLESEKETFKPGDEGFDLVSATPFGRKVPFMQADYPDIIRDEEIDHYEIHMISGTLNLKCVIKPKDESGA